MLKYSESGRSLMRASKGTNAANHVHHSGSTTTSRTSPLQEHFRLLQPLLGFREQKDNWSNWLSSVESAVNMAGSLTHQQYRMIN